MSEKESQLTLISSLLPGIIDSLVLVPEPAAPTVQSKHHYTRRKQIHSLALIPEDGSQDMGFMARLLTLCSLPRTDPGNRLQYKRQNGAWGATEQPTHLTDFP